MFREQPLKKPEKKTYTYRASSDVPRKHFLFKIQKSVFCSTTHEKTK